MRRIAFAVLFLAGSSLLSAAQHGPDKGTLVIVGGNMSDPAIVKRFIDLAGGPTAPIVIVPTAGENDDYDEYNSGLRLWRENGATNLTVVPSFTFEVTTNLPRAISARSRIFNRPNEPRSP